MVVQGSLAEITAPFTRLASNESSRVWNEKFPNVEQQSSRLCNISVFTNTNVGQCHSQLMTVSHVALDVHPSNRATTSAGPREEGLLATRAYVGVNAHIATRDVWRRG